MEGILPRHIHFLLLFIFPSFSFTHPISNPQSRSPTRDHFGPSPSSIYQDAGYFAPSSQFILPELDLFSKCIAMNRYEILNLNSLDRITIVLLSGERRNFCQISRIGVVGIFIAIFV